MGVVNVNVLDVGNAGIKMSQRKMEVYVSDVHKETKT